MLCELPRESLDLVIHHLHWTWFAVLLLVSTSLNANTKGSKDEGEFKSYMEKGNSSLIELWKSLVIEAYKASLRKYMDDPLFHAKVLADMKRQAHHLMMIPSWQPPCFKKCPEFILVYASFEIITEDERAEFDYEIESIMDRIATTHLPSLDSTFWPSIGVSRSSSGDPFYTDQKSCWHSWITILLGIVTGRIILQRAPDNEDLVFVIDQGKYKVFDQSGELKLPKSFMVDLIECESTCCIISREGHLVRVVPVLQWDP